MSNIIDLSEARDAASSVVALLPENVTGIQVMTAGLMQRTS